MTERTPIRRALVSVYDKTGLADLGRALADAGVESSPPGDPTGCWRKPASP